MHVISRWQGPTKPPSALIPYQPNVSVNGTLAIWRTAVKAVKEPSLPTLKTVYYCKYNEVLTGHKTRPLTRGARQKNKMTPYSYYIKRIHCTTYPIGKQKSGVGFLDEFTGFKKTKCILLGFSMPPSVWVLKME